MGFSSRPIPSSANNPCPVCQKTDGACRVLADETVFCHGFTDAKKFEKFDGYVCVAPAKSGHTATFKPDASADWTEERRREWEDRKLAQQQAAKEDERIKRDRALSIDERHKLYSEILDQLSTDKATLADLRNRGFRQAEIDICGFNKSVSKNQKLQREIDNRLPGVERGGRSLLIRDHGYLCPLYDFEGRIAAMQVRLHNPTDSNRYRWVSSRDQTLKLYPEGENPLTVIHPSSEPQGICIIEGVSAKPFFASQRLGLVAIGSPGGQWLQSPKLLEKYIKQAIERYGNLPVNFVPDCGWALNPQVRQKLSDTLDWLKHKFPKSDICVLDWNQIHKSQGDIDELDDLSIIRKLKIDSFRQKYKEVIGEDKGFSPKRYQTWADNRVKLTADIVQHEEWLSIPEGIQNECDILLIRKDLGKGKTQATIKFLQPLNVVTLLVGYRNTLLNNTIARANDMGLAALHLKDMVEKVQGDYINFAADDTVKLWGGCADSFHKFNAIIDRNPEYYFVHDEIVSVLGHLMGGGTLKNRQQQAIEWDVNAIRNSKFSIMMDGNLCDQNVEFIRAQFPEKRIKVLDSIYPVTPKTFYFVETEADSKDYTTSPKYLPSQLIEKAKSVNKVLWLSDSQRSCEVADEILTKHGHKHFRLDGKTSHEELAKQMQSAPKEFILTEKLDSLSLSPSAESGLSIDLYEYFDAVCFDVRGTLGVNALTQLSARLRDTSVSIFVACPEFVNMTPDFCPYALKNVEQVISQRIDMLLGKAMQTDGELINSQFVSDIFSQMAQKFSQDPWFIESLKNSKNLKYEHGNLKLTLKTAITQAGHRVIDLVKEVNEDQYDEVQGTKEFVKRREAEKIFNSLDLDYEKAQELDKQDVSFDIKCQIRKARLKHQLPGIEETPSWNADFVYTTLIDKPEFLNKRWRLKRFQDETLSEAAFKAERKYNFEFGFQAKDVWKANSTKLEALKLLGIDTILDIGEFSSQDTWVRQIIDKYYDDPTWFNLIGIPRAKQSFKDDGSLKSLKHIKTMIDRFLDYFGFESKQSKVSRGNRSYALSVPEPFEEILPDIDACLKRRADTLIEEMHEISLSAIADKAEEVARQQKAAEDQRQVELNKRMLEMQLTQNESDLGCNDSINIYNHNEIVAPKSKQDPLITELWNQPEEIENVASLLKDCDNLEMLAELRQCDIPVSVLKQASRSLEAGKRKQIKQWVLELNRGG